MCLIYSLILRFQNHFFSALSLKSNKLPVIEGAKSITLTVPITGPLTVPLIAPLTVVPEMSKIGVIIFFIASVWFLTPNFIKIKNRGKRRVNCLPH